MSKFLKGKLIKWNSDKGFGFIQPENSSKNIFIHISDFSDKGFSPYLGEIIFYKIGRGKEGKEKAICAYSERKQLRHVGIAERDKQKNYKKSFSKRRYMLIALFGIFILIGSSFKSSNQTKNTLDIKNSEQIAYIDTENTGDTEDIEEFLREQDEFIAKHTVRVKHSSFVKDKYHCDGRQYCSKMTSCKEAKYFLKHCPNTKMDGDGDGIPCESQWCGH